MSTVNLSTTYDHPAVLLDGAANSGPYPTGQVSAAFLRIYEKDHSVTFAALHNDALAAVREAYEATQAESPDAHTNYQRASDLASAVRDLLGLEE